MQAVRDMTKSDAQTTEDQMNSTAQSTDIHPRSTSELDWDLYHFSEYLSKRLKNEDHKGDYMTAWSVYSEAVSAQRKGWTSCSDDLIKRMKEYVQVSHA